MVSDISQKHFMILARWRIHQNPKWLPFGHFELDQSPKFKGFFPRQSVILQGMKIARELVVPSCSFCHWLLDRGN